MKRINFELNVTLRCNLECPNCNRHCHLKPKWAEDSDMEHEQVLMFVDTLRNGPIKAKRVKIAGGEPLLHPHLEAILEVLMSAVDEGLIQKVKVDSNGTLPILGIRHESLHWSGRKPAKKSHLPCLWSPTDLELPILFPCSQPTRCGISLDSQGYLPCSPAIAIVRSGIGRFGGRDESEFDVLPDDPYWAHVLGQVVMEHLSYRGFTTAWYMESICKHCVHAAPKAWREDHCKPLNEITAGEKLPTETWAEAMQR